MFNNNIYFLFCRIVRNKAAEKAKHHHHSQQSNVGGGGGGGSNGGSLSPINEGLRPSYSINGILGINNDPKRKREGKYNNAVNAVCSFQCIVVNSYIRILFYYFIFHYY